MIELILSKVVMRHSRLPFILTTLSIALGAALMAQPAHAYDLWQAYQDA